MAFFETLITNEVITGVCRAIGEYLFGASADNFFDYAKARGKAKKILKADLSYMNQKLDGFDKSKQDFIKEFLLNDVFNDSRFLYTEDSMPEDRKDILREKFIKAYKIEFDDTSNNLINPEKYENILVDCVNNHKMLVVNNVLNDSQRVLLQMLKKSNCTKCYSNLFGYTGKTLNASSELQAEANEIDYSHLQLESILHALRMDLRHYKVLLLLSVAGMIIYAVIIAFASPHLVNGSIFLMVAVVFIAVLLFLLFFSCAWRVHYYERIILKNTYDLWNVQFKLYNDRHTVPFAENYSVSDYCADVMQVYTNIFYAKQEIELEKTACVNDRMVKLCNSVEKLRENQYIDAKSVDPLISELSVLRDQIDIFRREKRNIEKRNINYDESQLSKITAAERWLAQIVEAITTCKEIKEKNRER